MIDFEIQDMTCGHCRAAITRAVLGVDSAAAVEVDLARRIVRVDSAQASAQRFSDAIAAAGYTPTRVATPGERAATSSTGGCSCTAGGATCGMRLEDLLTAAGVARHRAGGHCCSTDNARCGS
ncbi:MAG: heavy-metal-associated domain-containing protein [Betaproteobacteria bacterium]